MGTWATNPATGQPWTQAEVNALQAGVQKYELNAYVDSETRVTQVYVTVAFDVASYTYADGPTGMNTLSSVARNGATTTYTWDANGNVASKTGGWTYEWTPEGLMSRALMNGGQQQRYNYDGLGRRVKVEGTTGATWTVSIVSGMDAIYEKDQAGAVTKYVYANGMRVAKLTSTGAVHYFLSDHQGSTRKILDSARVEQYAVEYEPFGKPFATSGPQPDTHKYTMEKHDDPTGLVYLRARQYDPEIGRFVGADPVLGVLSMPQTLNRYAYVVNNPMRHTDPTGEFWFKNPIGDWWDSLDSTTKGVILIAAAVALIISTAGVGSVLVGAYAAGTLGATIGTALITFAAGAAIGAVASVGVEIAGTAFTGQPLTLESVGSAALGGAVIGGVGAVAPLAGGSIAMRIGLKASSLLAKVLGYTFVGLASAGVSYAQGHRDPNDLAAAFLIGFGAATFARVLAPTTGMTTFLQAGHFATRTLAGFLRGGPNAAAAFGGALIAFIVKASVNFYAVFWAHGLPRPTKPTGGGHPYDY